MAKVVRESSQEKKRRDLQEKHWHVMNENDEECKKDLCDDLEIAVRSYLMDTPAKVRYHFGQAQLVIDNTLASQDKKSADFEMMSDTFRRLEKYAVNLIVQPYRQELATIFVYTGFYVNKIERYVSSATEIFKQLGYHYSGDSEYNLDLKKFSIDDAADMAFDCLLACIECQIMNDILQRVKNHGLSMQEIVDYRKTHFGDVESCVESLIDHASRHRHRSKYSEELLSSNMKSLSLDKKLTAALHDGALPHNKHSRRSMPANPYAAQVALPQSSLDFQYGTKSVNRSRPESWLDAYTSIPQSQHVSRLLPSTSSRARVALPPATTVSHITSPPSTPQYQTSLVKNDVYLPTYSTADGSTTCSTTIPIATPEFNSEPLRNNAWQNKYPVGLDSTNTRNLSNRYQERLTTAQKSRQTLPEVQRDFSHQQNPPKWPNDRRRSDQFPSNNIYSGFDSSTHQQLFLESVAPQPQNGAFPTCCHPNKNNNETCPKCQVKHCTTCSNSNHPDTKLCNKCHKTVMENSSRYSNI